MDINGVKEIQVLSADGMFYVLYQKEKPLEFSVASFKWLGNFCVLLYLCAIFSLYSVEKSFCFLRKVYRILFCVLKQQ